MVVWKSNQKAKQRIRFGSAFLVASLVITVFTAFLAGKATPTSHEALLSAVQAGQELKALVEDKPPLADYLTATPELALQTIHDTIREQKQLELQSPVSSASFSPDGQQILTSSEDKTVRVWDLSGKQLALLIGHQNTISSASFSPDGQRDSHLLI